MPFAYLERKLVNHCASTIMGKKPACLVCFPKDDLRLKRDLDAYLKTKPDLWQDLEILILARSHVQYVYVYRRTLLCEWLQKAEVKSALAEFGYVYSETEDWFLQLLLELRARLQSLSAGFPHEIGLFLGYPVADVRGFITCGGSDCLISGYWKVYADQEQAKARFAEFNACRDCLLRHMRTGSALWDCPLEEYTA